MYAYLTFSLFPPLPIGASPRKLTELAAALDTAATALATFRPQRDGLDALRLDRIVEPMLAAIFRGISEVTSYERSVLRRATYRLRTLHGAPNATARAFAAGVFIDGVAENPRAPATATEAVALSEDLANAALDPALEHDAFLGPFTRTAGTFGRCWFRGTDTFGTCLEAYLSASDRVDRACTGLTPDEFQSQRTRRKHELFAALGSVLTSAAVIAPGSVVGPADPRWGPEEHALSIGVPSCTRILTVVHLAPAAQAGPAGAMAA